MRHDRRGVLRPGAWAAALSLLAAAGAEAQTRVTLPAGSVVLVRTEQGLDSRTMRVGQAFETTVVDPVSVNGYAVIPAGSRIRGVVSYVQPASRQQSGVMQVGFDRLTLPGGRAVAVAGRLTSTDAEERRQIEARADSAWCWWAGAAGSGRPSRAPRRGTPRRACCRCWAGCSRRRWT